MSGGGSVSLGGSITLTNAGVTSAAAGTGISVNSSTGAVTVTHGSTSSLNGALGGNGISSITVDAFGHVTAVSTPASPYATELFVTSKNYITAAQVPAQTQASVIAALTYTPYNSTNPNGYISTAALAGYATETFVTSKNYITSAGSCAYATSAGSAPASDVYAWAKASTKPSYTKSEVGLSNVDNTADANKSVNYATSAGTATNQSGGTVSATTVNTSSNIVCGGFITAVGDITAGTSDDRLKDRFGNIPDALNKVLKLNGFYYTHNKTAQQLGLVNKGQRVGISAQEVLKVLPEVIRDAPIDESYMTVDYSKMVPLLIEAIKGLNAKVESLEAQLKK
jgi:hypothetical protein